jgi:UDP-3-O-[3-hydroxymyristoyl] N-acetylglucosamine deacetylase
VLISTTEHLLSALIGFGVDNVIVEVDNLELPILDGSALPYVEAFQSVGLKQQRRKREYIRILKQVEVRDGSKFIGVYPGSGYGIDYTIDFPAAHRLCETSRGDLETGDYAGSSRRRAPSASRKTSPSCATWA